MAHEPSNMAEVIEELAIGIEVTPEEAADEVKQLWREVAAERMKRAMHEVIDGSEEAEE